MDLEVHHMDAQTLRRLDRRDLRQFPERHGRITRVWSRGTSQQANMRHGPKRIWASVEVG